MTEGEKTVFEKKNKSLEQIEDILIYDEKDSIARSQQKSRRIFVFYIIALFCVALVIILASYVVQSNKQRELEDMGARLNKQVDVAQGAQNRAERIQAEMNAIQKKNKSLKKQLDETSEKLTATEEELKKVQEESKTSQQDAEALMLLWQLEKVYLEGDVERSEELIGEMDRQFGRSILTNRNKEPLTGDAADEYSNICSEIES